MPCSLERRICVVRQLTGQCLMVPCLPQELGVDVAPRFETLSVEEPPKHKAGVRVASVAELVEKLRHEAKVI